MACPIPVKYTAAQLTDLTSRCLKMRQEAKSAGEQLAAKREWCRLLTLRGRLEQRGLPTTGLPERARGTAQTVGRRPHTNGFKTRAMRGELVFELDYSGEPVHGDAMERLERLCA